MVNYFYGNDLYIVYATVSKLFTNNYNPCNFYNFSQTKIALLLISR